MRDYLRAAANAQFKALVQILKIAMLKLHEVLLNCKRDYCAVHDG